jgi:hypothetical protein
MSKVTMKHGRAIRQFDWDAKAKNSPTIREIHDAVRALMEIADASQKTADELARSNEYTPEGRKARMREFVQSKASPALKAGAEALRGAEVGKDGLRILMDVQGPNIDKMDAAGAMRRWEIRQWLRGLPDGKRTAMLTVPDELDPEIAAAITETIPDLSGTTVEQHGRMKARALFAQHPDVARDIANIDEAAETLADTVRMTRKTLEKAGIASTDIDQAMGIQTMSERIAERLAGEDDAA